MAKLALLLGTLLAMSLLANVARATVAATASCPDNVRVARASGPGSAIATPNPAEAMFSAAPAAPVQHPDAGHCGHGGGDGGDDDDDDDGTCVADDLCVDGTCEEGHSDNPPRVTRGEVGYPDPSDPGWYIMCV
jgi:hypothetical protein